MMQQKSLLTIFIAIFMVSMLPAQQLRFQKNRSLSAKDTIKDNSIVIPADMERNYDQLLFDWNKQFLPSRNCSKQNDDNIVYPDSVYINRLYAMPTIMEMAYNQVTRAYIDMYSERRRAQVEYMLAIGKYFFPIFEQALDKYNIPMELKYLPVIESALNPVAISRVGATGLWQFMAPTGKRYDLEVNSLVDERRDPVKSSEAAARYLKDMYAIYGDWNLVIAAYNCGPGNVNKAIRRSGGKRDYWEIYPYLPKETRGYVPAFIAANYIMNYYKSHNLCPLEYSYKDNTDTVHVNKNIHLQQIADVLNISLEKLREMNPQYKSDIIPGDFKEYAICLPTKKICDFVSKEDSIFAYRTDEFLVHRKIVNFETLQDEYVSRTVYYKSRRGETVAQVARKYGVSASDIKKWNGLRSNRLSKGVNLAIKTKVKVRKTVSSGNSNQGNSPSASSDGQSTFAQLQNKGNGDVAELTDAETQTADVSDSDALVTSSSADEGQSDNSLKKEIRKADKPELKSAGAVRKNIIKQNPNAVTKNNSETLASESPVHVKVASGDNLFKIASQYHVTTQDIQKWNNLKSEVVKSGQELIVYTKSDGNSSLASEKTQSVRYKVENKDNLGKIAEKYNVTIDELKTWNNLTSNVLKIGQELIVRHSSDKSDDLMTSDNLRASKVEKIRSNAKSTLTPSHRYYSVKRGDTLDLIARKYQNASVRDIKVANNLKSDKLSVGQKLKIPII